MYGFNVYEVFSYNCKFYGFQVRDLVFMIGLNLVRY